MDSTAEPAPGVLGREGLIESGRRAFFRSFFRILLAFVALAEWACFAWALGLLGLRPPLLLHVLGPVAIFFFNRVVIVRGRERRTTVAAGLVRAYVGVAFTSIFCGLVLAICGLFWPLVALLGAVLPTGPGTGLVHAYVWVTDAAVAGTAALLFFGYTLGRRQIAMTQLAVGVPDLPPPFAGLRVVHLSDLHIGSHLDLTELAEHVRRVNALAPDLICITGDLVDRPETCAAAFPTLAGLRARHGVVVTLGNHDFYAGADMVTAALRRWTAFTVLRNARLTVEVDGAALDVLGIDDLGRDWARGVAEHPALPGLAAVVPRGRPFVVLSHRPDCFRQAARLGAALVLSGHTHGGQLALPAWPGRRAPNLAQFITEFHRGLYRDGGATLYVNSGLGFTGQKVRLFTPREIACLELRAAAPDGVTSG